MYFFCLKRFNRVYVWCKINWEENFDRRDVYIDVSLEVIGLEFVFDLIREINRGK